MQMLDVPFSSLDVPFSWPKTAHVPVSRSSLIRIDRQGLPNQLHGQFKASGLTSDQSQMVQRSSVFGLPGENLSIEVFGLLNLTRLVVPDGELKGLVDGEFRHSGNSSNRVAGILSNLAAGDTRLMANDISRGEVKRARAPAKAGEVL
jgi:hypothetical protein